MNGVRWCAALGSVALGLGCQQEARLSTEQWSAIETREIEGKSDDILRAAAEVVLDDGYYFSLSDHSAGLIAGDRVPSPFQESYQRTGGMARHRSASDRVVVWVRPDGEGRAECRLQLQAEGVRLADSKRVTEFWARVQRRMMGDEKMGAGQ